MPPRKKHCRAPITLDAIAEKLDGFMERTDRKFVSVQGDIEKLAQSSVREFEVIRSEMATKSEMASSHKALLHAIETMDAHLSVTASQWTDDVHDLHHITKDHEERLRLLEKRHRLAS